VEHGRDPVEWVCEEQVITLLERQSNRHEKLGLFKKRIGRPLKKDHTQERRRGRRGLSLDREKLSKKVKDPSLVWDLFCMVGPTEVR